MAEETKSGINDDTLTIKKLMHAAIGASSGAVESPINFTKAEHLLSENK